MSIAFPLALIIALYYWFSWWDNWWGPIHGYIVQDSILIGALIGLLMGDVTKGIQLGAYITMLYIGNFAAGANLPQDNVLATCIAVPFAIQFNLSAEAAMAFAIPFGLMGSMMDNLRRLINSMWNDRAHKHIDELNWKGLTFDGVWGPILVQFPIRVIPVVIILMGLGTFGDALLNFIPEWLMNGFSVVGGMLPGMGLVLCVRLIGRVNLLPYFIIGFFMAVTTGWGTLTIALFALAAAFLHIQFTAKNDEGVKFDFSGSGAEQPNSVLTARDHRKFCSRLMITYRISQSLEYLYGTGVCYSMIPILKKIYKGNDEGLKESLHRHLAPYISEMMWGNCIMGAVVSMEETIANGEDLNPEVINSLKTGLMGPFAGLGDTVQYYTIMPILKSIFAPFAIQGSFIGFFWAVIQCAADMAVGYFTYGLGYRLGRRSILGLLKSGIMNKIMIGAGVLGTMMMGCMCASYINLGTSLEFTVGADAYALQGLFDMFVPGLLPFLVSVFAYVFLAKGKKYSHLMLWFIAIGLIGGSLGILSTAF